MSVSVFGTDMSGVFTASAAWSTATPLAGRRSGTLESQMLVKSVSCMKSARDLLTRDRDDEL